KAPSMCATSSRSARTPGSTATSLSAGFRSKTAPASTATSAWETLSSTGPAARNRTSASRRADVPPDAPIEQSPTGAPLAAENGSEGDHRSVVLGPRDRLVGPLYIEGDLRV